jgi:hypothetical protein
LEFGAEVRLPGLKGTPFVLGAQVNDTVLLKGFYGRTTRLVNDGAGGSEVVGAVSEPCVRE